ncbi:alanine racemase [Candidatus Dojkabacteria bacterium]|nr:alanine racemase [Candidatus Dojkabacteria bacterium]
MAFRQFINKIIKSFEKDFSVLNSIEVSSSRICHNFDLYNNLNPGKEIWPVLKANAYGHGIENITSILKAKRPTYFVVDSFYEALKTRYITDSPVLLIGYTEPSNLKKIDTRDLSFTVYDVETIKALGSLKKKVKVHLKIDTGMNRQGIVPSEVEAFIDLIKSFPNLKLEGVCSHFSDADNKALDYSNKQMENFDDIVDKIKYLDPDIKYFHMAASAAAAKNLGSCCNAIRLGIGLYGINPLKSDDKYYFNLNKLKPALRLVSKVVQIKRINKGSLVSYNGTYKAKSDMDIGVLPLGYYEGIDRRFSNKGFVKYRQTLLPIIGRVCMNLTVIDLSHISLNPLDEVIVFSDDSSDLNSVSNAATLIQTIPYELLVHLSESIRRVVV